MNNETLFTINFEDKATSKINTIGNELSKLQTDFNKMCNLQPYVMVGNLLAQISAKLSFIGQNSLFAVLTGKILTVLYLATDTFNWINKFYFCHNDKTF